HADAEQLTASVERALPGMERLIGRAADEDVLTIYVNDNFGAWTSDRNELLRSALESEVRDLVEPSAPRDDTLFGGKGRHSILFQTRLEYLLGQEGVDRVVLIGQVTEQCVLYS